MHLQGKGGRVQVRVEGYMVRVEEYRSFKTEVERRVHVLKCWESRTLQWGAKLHHRKLIADDCIF